MDDMTATKSHRWNPGWGEARPWYPYRDGYGDGAAACQYGEYEISGSGRGYGNGTGEDVGDGHGFGWHCGASNEMGDGNG